MAYYLNLDGIKQRRLPAPDGHFVKSPAAALRKLRTLPIVAAAGDRGSISVWHGDDGRYRCAFYSFGTTVDFQRFALKREVSGWLREWWPKQGLE
jgi:hypothetical protein